MLLLSLDTSTAAVGAALSDGQRVLAHTQERNPLGHAELLAPGVEYLLRTTGTDPQAITAVAVGRGPGPFTGLRVGLATAATLAHAWNVPLYGLCSLDALAYQVWQTYGQRHPQLCVMTDARRKEVYWATYQLTTAGPERVEGPHVNAASDIPASAIQGALAGQGAQLYVPDHPTLLPDVDVDAGAVGLMTAAILARGDVLSDCSPLYLRRPDAQSQPSRSMVPSHLRLDLRG